MAQYFWKGLPPSGVGTYTLPADRMTLWQPGVTYNTVPGQSSPGIPSYPTVVAGPAPLGGTTDDSVPIQNALDAAAAAHPTGVVVTLQAGTYNHNNTGTAILMNNSNVILRGAGAGQTIFRKVNGATPTTLGVGGAAGPNPGAAIVIGVARAGVDTGPQDDTTNTKIHANLVADAVHSPPPSPNYSITVDDAVTPSFAVGMLVLLDENSGALQVTDPVPTNAASGMTLWASPDYRVCWMKHVPRNMFDDFASADFPTTPGTFGDQFSRLDRVTCEVKEIASINTSVAGHHVVTFTSPIHISYRVSHAAQITRFVFDNDGPNFTFPVVIPSGVGVEGITFQGFDNGTVVFGVAKYCWMKGCEQSTWVGATEMHYAFRCENRQFYSHAAAATATGGGSYAQMFSYGSADCLIEDSISIEADKTIVARAAGAGCVVGYSYLDRNMLVTNDAWIEIGINGSHLVGPHHILFEGNIGQNGDSDKTHGNSIYHTFFRNHLRGYRENTPALVQPFDNATLDDFSQPGNGPKRCAGLGSYTYWMSFVGNVLGISGQHSGWAYESQWNAGPAIWMLGVDSDFNNIPTTDPTVKGNSVAAGGVIRDGNWDWLHAAQRWETSLPATIPNSLYVTSAPAFFATNSYGINIWPIVDPTTGTTHKNPAKARWDAGTPNLY